MNRLHLKPSPIHLRSLLWVDCAAAGAAGIAMLSLSHVLAPLFGVPRALLVTTASINLAYGAFSFTLARRPEPPRRRVLALIAANFTWTAVCVVLALAFARPGATLGAAYIVAEGLFVAVLAGIETRAFRSHFRR